MDVLRTNSPTATQATWLKRAGLAGFLFFLVKGLLWLILPTLLLWFGAG
jgi:hypothetical protein